MSTIVDELYRRYEPAVFRRAYALLGNRAEADDAVQEVFLRVIGAHDAFRGQSAPMTWLYRITTNLCLNRLRDARRRAELWEAFAPRATAEGRRSEFNEDVRRLLADLPEEIAAAGVYYYLDGMTHDEIASVFVVSRRTAGNWVARFASAAKERLASDGV